MTIVEERRAITGGADTHSEVHVAAALDPVGGLLGTRDFPATTAGYASLLGWLDGFGEVTLIGVEGTGSYGAGLSRYLGKHGVRVVEVDRAGRQDRRRNGKSHPLDAVSAARAALSGRALVSCVAGKFQLQLAKALPRQSKAQILVNGPEITYKGQSQCGGADGDTFVVQSFKVKLQVKEGDYIAIKTRSTGTLSCSGGSGFLLYAPPLPLGGKLKTSHSGASCDLLVQLSYN